VAEHYLSLSPQELVADVVRHYTENVWPQVEKMIGDPPDTGLVLEGSAVLPELAGTLPRRVAAFWLTAQAPFFERRIKASSNYREKSGREREMIEKFIERTLLFNKRMVKDVQHQGLTALDSGETSIEELTELCLIVLKTTLNLKTGD
jgi:hypothetical protein